jgi:hypothetical protein
MLPHEQHDRCEPVLVHASFKDPSSFVAPPKHRGSQDAALAAAGGKLYLLGGKLTDEFLAYNVDGLSDPSRLEVFEPHTGAWYTASSPLPYQRQLTGHSLVANKAEGLLVALGGTAHAPDDVWDSGMVAKYDIKEGTAAHWWLKSGSPQHLT